MNMDFSYRCYQRVTADQKKWLFQLLDNNPSMLVLEAAQITGIKYPRATAIYRVHRRTQSSNSGLPPNLSVRQAQEN